MGFPKVLAENAIIQSVKGRVVTEGSKIRAIVLLTDKPSKPAPILSMRYPKEQVEHRNEHLFTLLPTILGASKNGDMVAEDGMTDGNTDGANISFPRMQSQLKIRQPFLGSHVNTRILIRG